MSKPKIAIIEFPGTNCETESIFAIQKAGMEAEEFLWNRNPVDLESFDGFFIIGGFSYEDRSRSGIISAVDPLMDAIKIETEKGKPVLGICNGAQVLVESGLVPGLENYEIGAALAVNKRVQNGKVLGTGFYNTWCNIKLAPEAAKNAFTSKISKKDIINVPLAHGEGRFLIPEKLLEEMKQKGLVTIKNSDFFVILALNLPTF
jgi:phosphoribosylformylglycinamidine synthase